MASGYPTAYPSPSETPVVVGLHEWLKEVRLEKYQVQAESWCNNEGAVELSEVFENVEDFCQFLQLKNLEKKRVLESVSKSTSTTNSNRKGSAQQNVELPMNSPQITGGNFPTNVSPPQTHQYPSGEYGNSTVALASSQQQNKSSARPNGTSTSSSQGSQQQAASKRPVYGLPEGFGATELMAKVGPGEIVTPSDGSKAPSASTPGRKPGPTGAANQVDGYANVTVQRTLTPQNEGQNVCFGAVEDPYIQLEELGSGAMATVFKCYQRSKPQANYAVKVISLKRLKLQGGFNREYAKLQREAQILSTLRNKFITSLIDVVEQRDNLYLVMEQVLYGELFDRILDHNNEPYVSRFSEPEARFVFVQIAAGLQYVHGKQIVHRDLKPENILVANRNPLIAKDVLMQDRRWNTLMECNKERTSKMIGYEVKLSDFGLAKLVADGYSIACTRTGTPQYWAPEVATAHKPSNQAAQQQRQGYTFSADLWSLGVVLYVMLAGRYPFTGTAQQMEEQQTRSSYEFPKRCGLSNEVKYLITNLIRKEPRKRMSLLNCLRCKWSTRSMMMTKCLFYKQKIPLQHWNARRILLPLAFDHTTAAIMSTLFRGFPINMDDTQTYTHSHQFPGIPDNLDVPEQRVADNIRLLDTFKQAIWAFINDSGVDDIVDYEIDSYGNRYFFLQFRYLLESSSDVLWIKPNLTGPAENPQNPEKPITFSTQPDFYAKTNASDPEFIYSRREDIVAYELLYSVIPKVFGSCRILEMVPLFLSDKGHEIQVSAREQQGLLVESVAKDSPMFARVFPGDILLEIVGQPITSVAVFEENSKRQGVIMLVQRAV